MKAHQINFVNLIGKMSSDPKIINLENGHRIATFSLSTQEPYLDSEGNTMYSKNWHRITAWGKWIPILEKLCEKGQSLAIEGRLKSRFINRDGERKSFTEVEINDLVIL